jgi:N-acetylmuramoyl-L-alanine amidase
MIIKPKRNVNRVYLHCTDSDNEALFGQTLVKEVRRWHLARGFVDVGYHYLIDKFGSVMEGRPLEVVPAAQVGHNTGSIAICVHGSKDFTLVSLYACRRLCYQLWVLYEGALTFHGHHEVNHLKTCPNYNYRTLLALDIDGRIQLPMEQIIADAGPPEAFGVALGYA